MASVNKVIIVGHLGKDPEVRYTAGGDAVCNLSVATSDQWKDKQTGEKKEMTEWHRISMFGKLAEIAGQYLKKGAQVYIEGSLRTRKWTDKDGQEKYTTEIRCDAMQMLGGRQEGAGSQSSSRNSDAEYQPAPQRNAQGAPPQKRSFDDLGDDIPFEKYASGRRGHCM